MKKTLASIAALAALVGGLSAARAVVPDLIPLQGVLTDAEGYTIDADANMQFAIYDAEVGGNLLWSEVYNGGDAVEVVDGFFTVYLGSQSSLYFDLFLDSEELWLGITVGLDEEMDRIRLASVPFAQEALYCRQVGSYFEDDIQPVLDFSCGGSQFLRGWIPGPDGGPICETDKTFEAGDAGTIDGVVAVHAGEGLEVDTDPNEPTLWVHFGSSSGTVAEGNHDHDGDYMPPVTGLPCGAGYFVSNINPTTGAVTCTAEDTGEVYTAGEGLLELTPGEFSVDTGFVQVALSGSCEGGEFVSSIDPGTGAFACATPLGKVYTSGDGIDATEFAGDNIAVDFGAGGAQRRVFIDGQPETVGACEEGWVIKGINPVNGQITCVLDQTVTGEPGEGILSISVSPPLTGGGSDANESIGISMGTAAGTAAWGDHDHDADYPPIADTLAGMSCPDGQLLKWDDGFVGWVCADDLDTDTDTVLSDAEVIAIVEANIDYQADIAGTSCPHGIASINDLGEVTCSSGSVAWTSVTGKPDFDSLYVNEGQANSVTSSMIANGEVAPEDLAEDYATQSDLTAATSDMATQTWVGDQSYLTSGDLTGYATETWTYNHFEEVIDQGDFPCTYGIQSIATNGDVTCAANNDTNASTACDGDHVYMDGNGGCDTLSVASCSDCAGYSDARYIRRDGDYVPSDGNYTFEYVGTDTYAYDFYHHGTGTNRYAMQVRAEGGSTAVGGYFMGKNGTSTNIGVQTRADGGGNTTYGLMAEVSDYDDTARTGSAYGTWGYVEEFNYNRTGDAVGAYGEAWTEGAGAKRMIGVRGVADEGDESRSGQEYFGGHFEADAYGEATAVGVQGWATGSWNENIGVYGGTDVIGGYGVYGDASSATGYGLYTPDSAYVGYDLTVGDDLIVATGGTLSVDGHAGGVHTRYMVKNWHDVADQGQLWGMAVGNYNSYMRINADNSGILYFHFDVPDNSLVKEVECNFYQRDKPECLTLYLYNGTSQVAGPVTTTTIGAYTTLGFSSDDTLDLTPHTYGLSLRMDVDTAKDGYTYAYVNLYYCRAKYETYDFNY